MISLDLGSGDTPKNPYNAAQVYGVDLDAQDSHVINVDLVLDPIPFEDNSIDYVTAYDFIEHIPRVIYQGRTRTLPFINLINEIYRVLKMDGLFLSSTPAFPFAPAFQDPTHVNYITPETWAEYFDDQKTWASRYGFKGKFSLHRLEYNGPHLVCEMRKLPV